MEPTDRPVERVCVRSEHGTLQKAILHRPGDEIKHLTFNNYEEYLYEAVPDAPRMQADHEKYVEQLEKANVKILFVSDLLDETFEKKPDVAKQLLEAACGQAQPGLAEAIQQAYSLEEYSKVLIEGVTTEDLLDRLDGQKPVGLIVRERPFLLEPLPNFVFTRDAFAIIDSLVFICRFRNEVRRREALIMRTIFEEHPDFSGVPVVVAEEGTIEGGDICVLSGEATLVGYSERTSALGIKSLASALFAHTNVKRVYAVCIPEGRDHIHLDTLLNVIDHGKVIVYAPVINDVDTIIRYTPGENGVPASHDEHLNLFDLLAREFGVSEVARVLTGGWCPNPTKSSKEQRHQRDQAHTEQRHEGTNVLAVRPGEVFAYERNRSTNRALEAEKITVLPVVDGELVKGLGGPHCMTNPVLRAM